MASSFSCFKLRANCSPNTLRGRDCRRSGYAARLLPANEAGKSVGPAAGLSNATSSATIAGLLHGHHLHQRVERKPFEPKRDAQRENDCSTYGCKIDQSFHDSLPQHLSASWQK
jgi:hypothetical protein